MDELYHYGVLGMKWGIRKANYYDSKSLARAKKKLSSNPNDKAKARYTKKIDKINDKMELRKKMLKINDEVSSQSSKRKLPNKVLVNMFAGTFANIPYNTLKSRRQSSAKAFLASYASTLVLPVIGPNILGASIVKSEAKKEMKK